MKPLILLLFLTATLQASPESKLIYWGGITEQQKGEDDSKELGKNFPYLANIQIRKEGGKAIWIGSGGLFSNSWVITAKHVVKVYLEEPEKSSIRVKFPDGTVREVVDAFAHSECDVAILKLNRPVKGIDIPSLQSQDIPHLRFKFDLPMTITGANESFVAFEVIGHANDGRLFSPDILRGGDSGSPVIAKDAEGNDVILATLTGPFKFKNDGGHRFIKNMSYAQFSAIGGIRDWIEDQISAIDGEGVKVKWKDVSVVGVKKIRESIYRGTPEFQLNQAVYLYLEGRSSEANIQTLKLLPKLEGRAREAIARQLLKKCKREEADAPKH